MPACMYVCMYVFVSLMYVNGDNDGSDDGVCVYK